MGFGKDGKGIILREKVNITPGSLAALTVIESASNIALQDDFRVISMEAVIIAANIAATDALVIGFSDTEMSLTEVKECLEANGPTDRNDRVQMERATRPVWPMAVVTDIHLAPNQGMAIRKTIRWTFSDTEGFTWFAYNPGASANTTGAEIDIVVKYFGVWI